MQSRLAIQIAPTAEDMAHIACELIAAAASEAIARRRYFRIALAGGSTPRTVYRMLADDRFMDFRQWQIFWSDERCVPPTSPESNYAMVKETLLDRLEQPPAMVFRMAGEGEPDAAAAAYERAVRELVPPNPNAGTGETPRFDMILLGMGADGHTASLFPGSPALAENDRLIAANLAPTGQKRLTFTYPLINASRRVLILVGGAEKAATLKMALEGPTNLTHYPVQGVQLVRGALTWLLDAAASTELRNRPGHR